jgi:hypothetical protein
VPTAEADRYEMDPAMRKPIERYVSLDNATEIR